MTSVLLFLLALPVAGIIAIIAYRKQKKPQRIMQEGKLLKSETVTIDGEQIYVEKVAFKDWHVCIHAFYLISDKLAEGHTVVEQRWNYDDFCNITVRLEDYPTCLSVRWMPSPSSAASDPSRLMNLTILRNR